MRLQFGKFPNSPECQNLFGTFTFKNGQVSSRGVNIQLHISRYHHIAWLFSSSDSATVQVSITEEPCGRGGGIYFICGVCYVVANLHLKSSEAIRFLFESAHRSVTRNLFVFLDGFPYKFAAEAMFNL